MAKCFISPGAMVPSHSSCSVHSESSDPLNHPSLLEKKNPSTEYVKARTSRLLRERQSGWRCLEASGVFFWLKLQPDSSVSFRVKTKTFGVYGSQLEHISYLLSLMLQARFTFSWVCPLACSSGNLSPTPPPDLDSESNKACWVVALDK